MKTFAPYIIILLVGVGIGFSIGRKQPPKIAGEIINRFIEDIDIPESDPIAQAEQTLKVITLTETDTVKKTVLVPSKWSGFNIAPTTDPIRISSSHVTYKYADPFTGQISYNRYRIPSKKIQFQSMVAVLYNTPILPYKDPAYLSVLAQTSFTYKRVGVLARVEASQERLIPSIGLSIGF